MLGPTIFPKCWIAGSIFSIPLTKLFQRYIEVYLEHIAQAREPFAVFCDDDQSQVVFCRFHECLKYLLDSPQASE